MMTHASRSLAGLVTLALLVPLAGRAHAQPLDVTWTEIPRHAAATTGAQFGSLHEWDGERLLVRSNDRLDVYTFDGTTAAYEATLTPTSGDSAGFPADIALDHGRALSNANDAVGGQAVYEFALSGTTWSQVARVVNPMPTPGDGTIVHLCLDGSRMAVSQPYIAGNRGSVDLVRSTDPITWTTANRSFVLGPTMGEITGHSLRLRGNEVMVGALQAYVGGVQAGRVLLYTDNGTSLVPFVTIDNPTPAPLDQFGADMALDDLYLYIAAHYDDTDATDAGAVYVYDRAGVLQQTLYGSTTNGRFGGSISVDGDWMAISQATTFAHPGLAHLFLYQRDAIGLWHQRADIPAMSGAPATYFGLPVTLRGNVIVASEEGAPVGGVANAGRLWYGRFTERDGGTCTSDAWCTSGHCVGGVCCSTCGDAGTLDAGTDAAMSVDAGIDAAMSVDAGVDAAGIDVGPVSPDAARPPDAATSPDGAAPDAANRADAGAVPRIPLSCTCRAGASSQDRAPLILLGLVLGVLRVRNARRRA